MALLACLAALAASCSGAATAGRSPTPPATASTTLPATATARPAASATRPPASTLPPAATTHIITPDQPTGPRWTLGQVSPLARLELGAAVLNGKIYTVGGAVTEPQFHAIAEVLIYDPAKDSWSEAAPLPGPRHHLGLAELGGKLNAAGG
ncbi:MAG: kelch repeat-containing protein, partial [Anaerolineales bacterium]